MKVTLTGKNIDVSSPFTLKTSEPDRLSSDGEITGVDQARECDDASSDHSPVWELTDGYEPSLMLHKIYQCRFSYGNS